MKKIFITGTDTGIGKTFVSCLLLKELNSLGLKTFAIKPIATGCQQISNGMLQNDDALDLQTYSSIKQPYPIVNPIALKEPVAPHLAAEKMDIVLTKSIVKKSILASIQQDAEINIIEGIGGWLVPLNNHELLADVICELNIPIILVVGIKLGCLNHALLTYTNILSMNALLIGWIANCLSPDTLLVDENIDALQNWIKNPCLGVIPYNCQPHGHININLIQQLLF